MSYTKRDYRTHLSADGVIFLDGKEIRCTIVDVSTSGARIEIPPGQYFKNSMILSEVVNVGDVTDFVNQEMHFDGAVEIVRKEVINNTLYLSLNFSDIYFGLEHLPYKRHHYRKSFRSAGHIVFDKKAFEAISLNVSGKGMKIALYELLDINTGDEILVDFNYLNIQGRVRIMWHAEEGDHKLIGLEYIKLIRPLQDIPSFSNS